MTGMQPQRGVRTAFPKGLQRQRNAPAEQLRELGLGDQWAEAWPLSHMLRPDVHVGVVLPLPLGLCQGVKGLAAVSGLI